MSLFLSNAASHDLDLALERRNGTFVRFADDVVAITKSYTDALGVAEEFRRHREKAGLKINYTKSPGIQLFEGGPERSKRHFTIDVDDASHIEKIKNIDYLGHRISYDGVSLPDKTIKRIKERISYIINIHLFLHRRGVGGQFNNDRIGSGFYDWDLVTCVNEIRKYIYGGFRESHINGFLHENERPPAIRGLMSFFPLSTSVKQYKELDGWLANVIYRAHIERTKVVASHGYMLTRLSKQQLIDGSWYNFPSVLNDATLPSFVRGWRVARKYYRRYGLSGIQPPQYYSLVSY